MSEPRVSGALRGTAASVQRLLVAALCAVLLGGCVSMAAAINEGRAARAIARARQAAAKDESQFELTAAQAYLDKAREESAEASYRDSIRFSKRAVALANKAVEQRREHRQGASLE